MIYDQAHILDEVKKKLQSICRKKIKTLRFRPWKYISNSWSSKVGQMALGVAR